MINCQQKSNFEKQFDCNSEPLKKMELNRDFNESFSLLIPATWKTSLYYDNAQSEIFAADTTQTIQETYLMEIALVNGKININTDFQNKVKTVTTSSGLQTQKDGFLKMGNFEGYFHLGNGLKNDEIINVFQYYIKISDEKYFLIKTQLYGNENLNERLCQSFQMIKTLKITEK